ncbi:LCP family protein [Nocardioides panacis]|uniref:LCP family protein n=1 Tax=Nocardioides panacis TaxID=2849501 RepID=A0A975T257_9ACTN|nr:LCP family protein [Nocardioides panacis]QWZ09504.1 LCP family protein [Nocardioides panacis]
MVLVTVLALLAAAAAVGYVTLDRSIKTFDGRGISRHRPPPTVHGQNLLLIGSDSRAVGDRALGGRGKVVGRSDTTLLVHIYEGGRRAVAVSIPRDALVTVPACRLPDGTWSKPQHQVMFNEAFAVGDTRAGNPACTLNTVERLTGLRVDHTVVADFVGFAAMTRIVGGVPVCVPQDVYQGDLDPNRPTQGRLVFHRGVQKVSGARALDYVRLRHGVGDGSDIGRMRRQQAFIGAVITKVRREGLTPTKLLPLARAATENLTVDASLGSAEKLLSFVLGLRHMAPEDLVFVTTPWRYDGARVALVHPDVDQLWTALANDQPLSADGGRPARVRRAVSGWLSTVTAPVTVQASAARPALAQRTARALDALGLHASAGPATGAGLRSRVDYGPGQRDQALALATAVVGTRVRQVPAPGLRLVLGRQHRVRDAGAVVTDAPGRLPSSLTDGARSAATAPCTNVSYGG